MKESKTPTKKVSVRATAKISAPRFTKFLNSPEDKKRALVISLTLNAVFILALLIGVIASRVHNLTVAKFYYQGMQRTCPQKLQSKEETRKSDDVVTTTYYVSAKALESGCMQEYLAAAQIDDYHANPDHAKKEADKLRELSDSKELYVLQIKLLENGTQIAPSKVED